MFFEVPPSPGRDEELATVRRRGSRVLVLLVLVLAALALGASCARYAGGCRANVTEWLNDFYP